jgi:hypothetical protein
MKIEVLRCDGNSEILNLLGEVRAKEPYEENGKILGQGSLHCEATGMDYFFRADGRYDGWGMAMSMEVPDEGEGLPAPALDFINAIEADREINKKEQP